MPDEQREGSHASLGIFATGALVVGGIIGTGIFAVPAAVARFGSAAYPAFVVVTAGSILLAVTFAELAREDPRGGGVVPAGNLVHGSDQQGCFPDHPAVMVTDHVPAVRVPPDTAIAAWPLIGRAVVVDRGTLVRCPYDPTIYLGSAAHYHCGRPAYSPELGAVLTQETGLDGNGWLLDAGCGPGVLTVRLAHLFAQAVGLDPDAGTALRASRGPVLPVM
jgi:hypothetical protein